MKQTFLLLIALNMLSVASLAQTGAGMKLGNKYGAVTDSIATHGYPWRLPLMGAKVAKRGINVPYPLGIGTNYNNASQVVLISDLKVGFNGNEPVDMDFIKFGEVKAHVQTLTARADMWLLPFINVYGIIGKVWSTTGVNVVEPIEFRNEQDFNGYTLGIGTTLAGGYHGFVTINDFNYTWTDLDKLNEKVKALMITPRLGYNWTFVNHPTRSLTLWIGASGFFVNKGTVGTITIDDLNVNIPPEKLEEIKQETAEWYQNLKPAQQVVVKRIAEGISNKIEGLPDELTIDYSLQKDPLSHWSMVAGGQFQLDPRWQIRLEAGFLGGRTSGLISWNYRWRW